MALESLQFLKQREERTRALWQRRRDIPLAILGWTGVVALILWGAGHIVRTLLILILAVLLAYALAPAVKLFQRIMPQVLAMLLVYLIMLGALSALLFLIVNTAIGQVASLAHSVGFLLIPQGNGKLTPLEQTLRSFGISPSQIATARAQIVSSIEGLAGSAVPLGSALHLSHCRRLAGVADSPLVGMAYGPSRRISAGERAHCHHRCQYYRQYTNRSRSGMLDDMRASFAYQRTFTRRNHDDH